MLKGNFMRREQKRNFPKWLTLVGVFGVGILFNYAEYGSTNHLQKIKDCGFNVVQSYNALWWSDEVMEKFLDECQRLGLRFVPSFDCVFSNYELSENKVKSFITCICFIC